MHCSAPRPAGPTAILAASGLILLAPAGTFAAPSPVAPEQGSVASPEPALLVADASADGGEAEAGLVEGVTAEVEELSDEVREQYEWLSRRRSFEIEGVPHGATGLPVLFYTPSSGLTYGGWVQVASYKRRPYRYRVMVQWWLTTEGKRNHFIRSEIPTFRGTPFSLRVLLKDVNSVGAKFFGLGNDSKRNTDLIDRNKYYYQYRLEEQRTAFDLEGELPGGEVAAFYGLRFNRGLPTQRRAGVASYVFDHASRAERPIDPYDLADGRWRNFMAAGLILDTRDDKEFTTEGALADASVQWAPAFLWSDYDYTRLTAIGRQYWRFRPDFDKHTYVLFARVIAETIYGDAPFYALTDVEGAIRGKSGGSGGTLRGYTSRRFADKTKVLTNVELRRFLKPWRIKKQRFESQAIAFFDLGRVAPSLSEWRPTDLHGSGGVGVLVNWNAQLTLRLDLAYSPEGDVTLFSLGQVF